MKISYNNYPILESLKTGIIGFVPISAFDREYFKSHTIDFVKLWKLHYKEFSSEINVISKTFNSAAIEAEEKLDGLYDDIVENGTIPMVISGTYVIGDEVYMIHHNISAQSELADVTLFVFYKSGTPLGFITNNVEGGQLYSWLSENINYKDRKEKGAWFFMMYYLRKVITYSMFKEYAEVETKFIESYSRVKDIGCKYINDTGINITHLDCRWFTNIVNSSEFKVRGHFRLQPIKKDGKWTRELIWINEFKKHGYLSKAKKLLYGDS